VTHASRRPEAAPGTDLATAVRDATADTVEIAFADQRYTGPTPAADEARGIHPEVVTLPDAGRDLVLLPRPQVVGHSFACLELARDAPRFHLA
jgi:hypothetical protein